MIQRYDPSNSKDNFGWSYAGSMSRSNTGDFVHYSDYEKLVIALREVRRAGVTKHHVSEIAEAALLSAGEGL